MEERSELMRRLALLYQACGVRAYCRNTEYAIVSLDISLHRGTAPLTLVAPDLGGVKIWTLPDLSGDWIRNIPAEDAESVILKTLENSPWRM